MLLTEPVMTNDMLYHQKLKNELNWKPKISFNKGIDITIKWYLKKFNERKSRKK